MTIHDCVQGSPEWFAERLGLPTASQFGKILTGGGKPSSSSQAYMDERLADWLAGERLDAFEGNHWTDRGNELEDQARQTYSFITGNEVEEVGFISLDTWRRDVPEDELPDDYPDGFGAYEVVHSSQPITGCSPDGLIGSDGMLEIKCPKASTMVGYYRGDKLPSKYIPQVQGSLWITGRRWCDFFAFHPSLQPLLVRVERDEPYIKLLAEAVEKFVDKMLTQRAALEAAGWRIV